MSDFNIEQPEYLYRLAKTATPEARQDLTNAITSILSTSLTQRQQNIATDILLTIIKDAELDLRKQLAERLSVEHDVPAELVHYLAEDNEFSVAEPILIHSTALTDQYLINMVKERTHDYWRAIAKRRKVSMELASLLIGMSDDETLKILVSNPGAQINETSVNWMVGVARNFIDLQEPLLMRPEIDQKMATELYWYVSKGLRQTIVEKFHVQSTQIDKALEEIMQTQTDVKGGKDAITDDMHAYAERMQQRGRITAHALIDAIKRRNLPFFTALLSVSMKLDETIIRDIMDNDNGKKLGTMLRSFGMTKSDFTTIYLLIRSQKSESRITNSTELNKLLNHYDSMTVESARKVVNAWREQDIA